MLFAPFLACADGKPSPGPDREENVKSIGSGYRLGTIAYVRDVGRGLMAHGRVHRRRSQGILRPV